MLVFMVTATDGILCSFKLSRSFRQRTQGGKAGQMPGRGDDTADKVLHPPGTVNYTIYL